MGESGPFPGRQQLPEVALDLVRIVVEGETETTGDPTYVRVHEDRGLSERRTENDVGRLPADSGQAAERLQCIRHGAPVLLGHGAGRRQDRLRLLSKEAGALDERLDACRGSGGEHSSRRKFRKEVGRAARAAPAARGGPPAPPAPPPAAAAPPRARPAPGRRPARPPGAASPSGPPAPPPARPGGRAPAPREPPAGRAPPSPPHPR